MERAGLKIVSKTTLGNVGAGTREAAGGGLGRRHEEGPGGVRDLPKGRVSSPIRCSGLWRPDLTAPQPSSCSLGRVLGEGSGWITQSPAEVGTRSLTREGSRQDKESPGSCSRNTDAGGFPEEMACVLKKVPEVPFVPRPKTGRWLP